jgi:hypothetical protein
MFNSIGLADLELVVGGHCTCGQQGGDPSGGQPQGDPSQQMQMQQPGGEQGAPQQRSLSAEQVLQSIMGILGQYLEQQQQPQQQPSGRMY